MPERLSHDRRRIIVFDVNETLLDIEALTPLIIGRDPRRWEEVTAWLQVMTRQSRGGLNQQAIAAIENALLDMRWQPVQWQAIVSMGGAVTRKRTAPQRQPPSWVVLMRQP